MYFINMEIEYVEVRVEATAKSEVISSTKRNIFFLLLLVLCAREIKILRDAQL